MLNQKKLKDLGERRIIDEIIIPKFQYSDGLITPIGDDCAVIPWSTNNIVWTMDPAPVPISWLIEDENYKTLGWYSAAINFSDIASMGAEPIGLMLSIEAPPETNISDFEDILDGAKECADIFGAKIMGGNIKDSKSLSCVGTAIGSLNGNKPFTRNNVNVSDVLFCVGDVGRFWAAVIAKINHLDLDKTTAVSFKEALHRPTPRVKEAQLLMQQGLVTSCMDASDGLFTSLIDLSRINNISIEVTLSKNDSNNIYNNIYSSGSLDVLTALLAWGDWQLLCSVKRKDYSKVEELLQYEGVPYTKIGNVVSNIKDGDVFVHDGLKKKSADKSLINSRFSDSSYFTHGFKAVIKNLKKESFT
jgi:thiamine-monophosphate kinase